MLQKSLLVVFLFPMLFAKAQEKRVLQNGEWRAALSRTDGNDIIFNFEVKDSVHKKILYVKNAQERLLVDDIKIKGDSIFIKMPFFESQIKAVISDVGKLEGVWIKRLVDKDQVMPFTALHNQPFRFPVKTKVVASNVAGRWAVHFLGSKDTTLSVGEFTQNGKNVTGTFLNATGDYRYLQGVVDGDSLKLSCFDGGHAYLFIAAINNSKTIEGFYFAGPVYKEKWAAERNEEARLPDEFSLTKLKKDSTTLDFSFPDLSGKKVSIHDTRFKNKVVIIQIMGSWCPNCMDETRFLSDFYDQYHNKGVEVIALAYERSTDFERSQKSLQSFEQRFKVKYPILITGVSVNDSAKTEKTLPQLEEIVGFPTTIFVGRSGNVEKIHTGFNGPATGEHYDEEKNVFTNVVEKLLK